jgi:hypothetical protein
MRLVIYFIAVGWFIAAFPLVFLNIVLLLPSSMTHVINDQGTYDRRGWLRASEPLILAGMEEEAFLSRTFASKQ